MQIFKLYIILSNFNIKWLSQKAFSHSLMEWSQVNTSLYVGWSQVFVMQPFEIIKVRLQTQSSTNKMYNGIVDCLMKIVKN